MREADCNRLSPAKATELVDKETIRVTTSKRLMKSPKNAKYYFNIRTRGLP